MSVYVIQEVWDLSTAKGTDLLMLLALADNADQERRLAWPSVDLLAKKARIDRRNVQRCLRRLEEAGEIVLVRPGGRTADGYRAAVYRITPGQGRPADSGGADAAPPNGPGAAPVAPRGGAHGQSGVAPAPPQPSVEPSTTANGSPTDSVAPSPRRDAGEVVAALFGYWQDRCRHPQAKMTRERTAKVAARLRDGYTPEQIRAAIDGAARGAFVNDDGKRFDDLELICRSGTKLESFIDRPAPNGTRHSAADPSTGPSRMRDMAARLRQEAADLRRAEEGAP